jgi:hypothetical protein
MRRVTISRCNLPMSSGWDRTFLRQGSLISRLELKP